MSASHSVPLWFRVAYSAMAAVITVVYWSELGPVNFLWFSDIALFGVLAALWLNSRLLASTMAVGVLALELGWVGDFLSGGRLLGLVDYMFDGKQNAIAVLSGLFHCVLPGTLIYLLWRWGYDRRALGLQIAMTSVVLPFTYGLSGPDLNINWVYGPGRPQQALPPLLYLLLVWLVAVLVLYPASHWALRRLFSTAR